MKVIGPISVKIGEYEKNGQTKGSYQRIGTMMEGDEGRVSIKFDDFMTNILKLPFGHKFNGWANVWTGDTESKEETVEDLDDDEGLPF